MSKRWDLGDRTKRKKKKESLRTYRSPETYNPGGPSLPPLPLPLSASPNGYFQGRPRESANKLTIFARERRGAKIERTRLATSTADDFGGGVLSQTIRFEGNRKEKTARIHRPRPLTDNPGDAGRRSSVRFGLHGPGFLDIPLGAERRSKLPFVK